MKKAAAYTLLVLYLMATCRPAMPVISDLISHAFWKSQHIATVHHHHGNHHAEEEMAAKEHEDDDHGAGVVKFSEPVSVHNTLKVAYNFQSLLFKVQKYYSPFYSIQNRYLETAYPPPKS